MKLVPSGSGLISLPAATVDVAVVLSFRFIPNWLVPRIPGPALAIAGIVFDPEVRVGPATVILKPLVALVEAAI